jgi:hypothetical protein
MNLLQTIHETLGLVFEIFLAYENLVACFFRYRTNTECYRFFRYQKITGCYWYFFVIGQRHGVTDFSFIGQTQGVTDFFVIKHGVLLIFSLSDKHRVLLFFRYQTNTGCYWYFFVIGQTQNVTDLFVIGQTQCVTDFPPEFYQIWRAVWLGILISRMFEGGNVVWRAQCWDESLFHFFVAVNVHVQFCRCNYLRECQKVSFSIIIAVKQRL